MIHSYIAHYGSHEEEAFPKSAYSKEMLISYARKYGDSFFVVESGGDVVGYIIFDMNGHIHSTAVSRKQRRKGFGRMLFTHALKITKTRPWLEVRSKNVAAIEFIRTIVQNGYVPEIAFAGGFQDQAMGEGKTLEDPLHGLLDGEELDELGSGTNDRDD